MNSLRFWCTTLLGAAICVIGARSLSAQEASTANGVPVHVLVTVEPHKGNEGAVINKEDVMVFEGHDRDKVIAWVPAQGDHAGLELFILLDDASSTTLGSQLEDIRKFIDEQPASTKVGVAYMQNGIARVAQDLTSDHAQAEKAFRLPLGIRGANASPYFALSDLIKRWPASADRREVIMASDGIDLYYGIGDLLDPYLMAAIEDAQHAGILVSAIYTPGVGHLGHSYWLNYWGQLYLSKLAEETGGESYYIGFTGSPVAFAPYLQDQTQRFGRQYLLTFLVKPPKKADLLHIKIRTEVPKVDLVAADEVYVSPPAK